MNNTLSEAPISNSSIICASDTDCLNGGACALPATLNASCQCFRGYWGTQCERGLYELQAPLVIVHHVLMLAVFFTLSIFAAINFAAAIILTRRSEGKVVDRMVAVLFAFVLFGCVERLLYLAIDPYWMYRVLPIWLENILYGLCLWALISCAILIVTAWVVVYNKMNPRAPVKWFRRIAALAIFILFGLSVGTDAARYYSSATQRTIYGWVYRVALVIFASAFSIWFLWYGRQMYKTLKMFKTSAINKRLMHKIYFIANTTAVFTIVFVFLQIGSNVAQIVFASIHVFLPYQFLFRLQEAGYFIIVFRTFNFHEQWKAAFRSDSSRSTAVTAGLSAKRTTANTSSANSDSKTVSASKNSEEEALTSMAV